ncbi:hypothetical protein BSFP_002930 [Burkholderia stabilis]|uniref:Uncharacterized protein n=1 Tax=Burkholderia stabilis TaxID=95485 RepID=A0A1Y1BC05_9BURK|nr:hypothetical protein BSFP_002930 [Burkholderia stabilis]
MVRARCNFDLWWLIHCFRTRTGLNGSTAWDGFTSSTNACDRSFSTSMRSQCDCYICRRVALSNGASHSVEIVSTTARKNILQLVPHPFRDPAYPWLCGIPVARVGGLSCVLLCLVGDWDGHIAACSDRFRAGRRSSSRACIKTAAILTIQLRIVRCSPFDMASPLSAGLRRVLCSTATFRLRLDTSGYPRARFRISTACDIST